MAKKVSEVVKRGLNRLTQNKISEMPETESLKDKLEKASTKSFQSIQSEVPEQRGVKSGKYVDEVVVPDIPNYNFDMYNKEKQENAREFTGVPQSLDELVAGLNQINNTYNGVTDRDYYKDLLPEIRESLGLEKLEDVEIDKNKIEAQARAVLEEKNLAKKEGLEESTRAKIENVLKSSDRLAEEDKVSRSQINRIYDDAKEKVNTDALKRGLARSSIALLQIDGLEKSRAEELSALANKLSNDLSSNQEKIEELNKQLSVALEDLDIALAGEITNEVQKQIEALQKKQKEVVDFNNTVSKLEAEYQIKRQSALEQNQKLEQKLAQEYKGIANKSREEDIYSLAQKYFSTFSRDEGIKELTSNKELVSLLGSRFFDLYYELMNRK